MPFGEGRSRPRFDAEIGLVALEQRLVEPIDALRQRQPLARLDPQPAFDIGAFPEKLGLDIAVENQLPDDRRDEGLETGIGGAATLQRLKRHLDRAGHQRRDVVAVPADRAFGVQQHDIALECPVDRVLARGFAIPGDLRDQIVGEPEFLRQRAKPVDDAVGRPERRARADARRDFLVEHPVGEEFGMVGRDEGRLALRRRRQRAWPARSRGSRWCGYRRRRAGRQNPSA